VEWLASHIDAGSISLGDDPDHHAHLLNGVDQIGWLAHTDVDKLPQECTPLQLMCIKARGMDVKRAQQCVSSLVSWGADVEKLGLFHVRIHQSGTATMKASSGKHMPDWLTNGIADGKRIATERSKKRRDILYSVLHVTWQAHVTTLLTILNSFLPY
jgi:hypothetical protein